MGSGAAEHAGMHEKNRCLAAVRWSLDTNSNRKFMEGDSARMLTPFKQSAFLVGLPMTDESLAPLCRHLSMSSARLHLLWRSSVWL